LLVTVFALKFIVAKTPSLLINWLPNVSSRNNNFIVLPFTTEEKFTDGFNTISPTVIDATSNNVASKLNCNSAVAIPGTFDNVTGTATVSPDFTVAVPTVAVTVLTGPIAFIVTLPATVS